jgi:hypothetical protein
MLSCHPLPILPLRLLDRRNKGHSPLFWHLSIIRFVKSLKKTYRRFNLGVKSLLHL